MRSKPKALPASQGNLGQHRQIRALYDADTITVYQAYNAEIASAAVLQQRLDASPLFKPDRMTWIKPSWNWMMYRSGYSYKDANQSNILALKTKRECFEKLLKWSVNSMDDKNVKRDEWQVRVQWDPERNTRTAKLSANGRVRSIQIGVPAAVKAMWVKEGIVAIEDVTDKARELKRIIDEEETITEAELRARKLIPAEEVYKLSEEIASIVWLTQEDGAVDM